MYVKSLLVAKYIRLAVNTLRLRIPHTLGYCVRPAAFRDFLNNIGKYPKVHEIHFYVPRVIDLVIACAECSTNFL